MNNTNGNTPSVGTPYPNLSFLQANFMPPSAQKRKTTPNASLPVPILPMPGVIVYRPFLPIGTIEPPLKKPKRVPNRDHYVTVTEEEAVAIKKTFVPGFPQDEYYIDKSKMERSKNAFRHYHYLLDAQDLLPSLYFQKIISTGCALCRKPLNNDKGKSLDRIISRGLDKIQRPYSKENVMPMCLICNMRRGNTTFEELWAYISLIYRRYEERMSEPNASFQQILLTEVQERVEVLEQRINK